MVKVGFICEGATEKIIIESSDFKNFLKENNLVFIKAVDATGNGNLKPQNIEPFIKELLDEGADKIFILTDLDEDLCITKTKERINAPEGLIVIVAKKVIEAWFLADSKMLRGFFNDENFHFDFPENESNPLQVLNDLFKNKLNRGIGKNKPVAANKMVNNGFSISSAAMHPNCSSAVYFINKLRSINLA